MDGQVPMVRRKLPPAIFFFVEGFLVGEKLLRDLGFRLPRWSVLRGPNNDHAIIPAGIFAGMQTGCEDRVFLDVTELLLPFEDGDLVLLEDAPPLVLVAILNPVHPLDDDWLSGRQRNGLCLLHGSRNWRCGTGGEDEQGAGKNLGTDLS